MNDQGVIIPTYSRAHLVNRAIQSVLDQTYQNFDIIMMNEGSVKLCWFRSQIGIISKRANLKMVANVDKTDNTDDTVAVSDNERRLKTCQH